MAHLTRRDFLRLSLVSAASFAGATAFSIPQGDLFGPIQPDRADNLPIAMARVAVSYITIHTEPNFTSPKVQQIPRDKLVYILEDVVSPSAPKSNPIWYRIPQGYIHAARVQRIDPRPANALVDPFPEKRRLLAEVTVPYVRSLRWTKEENWTPLYRLYYSSHHWITGLEEGPGGIAYYKLYDETMDTSYFAPAYAFRVVPWEEYSPLATDVPAKEKRLVVIINDQTLTAYEGDTAVFHTNVSTGLSTIGPNNEEIPTDTPIGVFRIQRKLPAIHMGDRKFTSSIFDYELPGIPYTSFFHEVGVGFHGTYWHNNFGNRMSHGCVNMRIEEARWLFRWSTPAIESPDQMQVMGLGTLVQVFNYE